ncbi:hypothetical protein LguiB_016054 [Lonicera macranthoides]
MDEEMITLDNVMSVELAIKRELEYRTKMEVWKMQHQSSWKPLLPLQEPLPGQAGIKRKAPVNNFEDISILQPSSSSHQTFQNHSTGLVCEVCKLAFSTIFHLKQHCESLRHKGKLFHMKRRGVTLSNPLRCELCKCSCSGAIVLEQHLKGLKHIAAVQAFEKSKHARERL